MAFSILRGGDVLDIAAGTAQPADILVEDDTIREIGPPGCPAPADAVEIAAAHRLLHPGLVNAHTHGHGNLAKGMGDRWTLELLLSAAPWITGNRTAEDKYLSTQLGAVEMVMKGCTACYDLSFEWPLPTAEGLALAGKAYAAASFMGYYPNNNNYYSSGYRGNQGGYRGNQGFYRTVDNGDVNRGQCHHKHSDSRWDGNHDGNIDRSEWQRREAARYDRDYSVPQTYANYPSNYNGYNPDYYNNNRYNSGYNYNPGYAYNQPYGYNPAYNRQAALQSLDLNGDGYLSPQEWNGRNFYALESPIKEPMMFSESTS